ncbi:NAD(P)H-hydrate dehydratase [Rhodobacteraceae bacterium F11138]|nr:NAD(P)H-hydrate dehydratase [Rhodobacteraceae bacterium F11138]
MPDVLTAARMRAIEQEEIVSGRVSGLALMERAGAGVVAAILRHWPELGTGNRSAVVLCGPGNNGGDGFVIARLLQARGWEVTTCLLGTPDGMGPDARANHDRWLETGTVTGLTQDMTIPDGACPDVVVDALFGTGLCRPVTGPVCKVIARVQDLRRRLGVRCVAVDIPSGICADSGKALGCHMQADLTVSFHRAKIGHHLGIGGGHSVQLDVCDIGLPAGAHGKGQVRLVRTADPAFLSKTAAGQKYVHGHALVLSGGPGRTGAARLAARSALRIGAGLVTLGVPPAAQFEVAAHVTALMQVRIADADGLSNLLQDARLNALCLGPALGTGPQSRALIEAALASQRPLVLDADALTLFRAQPDDLFRMLHNQVVLTPHGGEFQRLFPDIARQLAEPARRGPAYSKVDATRAAAARAGCTVLFKGAATVIATADGKCAIHSAQYDRAAPWLATAGAGDVLAGFITGLLARGAEPMAACEMAVWLHVQCALDFGPGLIAEDIPEQLPGVLRGLGV